MSEIENVAENGYRLPNDEWKTVGHYHRTSCQCGSKEHSIDFWVEVDKDHPHSVELTVEMETYKFTDEWGAEWWNRWFYSARNRMKLAWKVLTTGAVQTSGNFMFRGDAQIDAFCQKVQEAKELLKKEI